jgi:hypothetical protein
VTGLSFDLTEEQEQLRQTVRDFADRECPKDVARRLEASEDFPEDLARRIAKAGLNGIGIPEEHGGQGGDLLDQAIVCEELSRTLGGLAWLWGITVWSGARAVLHHGSAAQKERCLPAVAAGGLRFAFAMTEPAGGVAATTAKCLTSEWAVEPADLGIQVLGGYGYAEEFGMQRYWRDARLSRIGPITNEMARNYIGETPGSPPFVLSPVRSGRVGLMISPEGLSVPALLDAAAEQDREAAVFPGGRACPTELSALSSSYARALVSLGAGAGDHVGALLPAGLPVVALILGAARIGAVAVPFNTRLRAGEIAYLADHSDVRIMLVSPDGADLLAAAFPALAGDVRPGDEFVVIYTSGTTANPRGCVHTHESVVTQAPRLTRPPARA